MRDKKEECPSKGAPAWMVTYGDMMTLLLTFFVLLISFATIEEIKFNAAISSIQEGMGFLPENASMFPRIKTDNFPQNPEQQEAAQIIAKMVEAMNESEYMDAVELYNTPERIKLVISDPLTFETGKATIKPKFKKILTDVAKIIKNTTFTEVRVEGHTDNVPIHTPQYPSNWELSAARALEVTKYLAFQGGLNPAHLSAIGYGEYRPRADNNTPHGRLKNRRVELYIERNSDQFAY